MTAKPPPLAEPIEWKLWKNRQRQIAIVVSLSSYEGQNLVSIREYFTDQAGCMRPSTKGLSMVVRRLPELSRAVRLALEKARSLDLLPEDGGE
jgi:Transcriptional Coactivator p15 (PC4)